MDFEEELKKLPAKPGVYLMHDAKDEIIYVGKAISLKNRVRQYFQSSRNKGVKIEQMVTHIARFEYIVTDSELEALVLECNLIKEHRPKYNTMLKDDKSYPFIRVSMEEEFPRVLFSRRMKKDKSKYFGPYTSVGAVKDAIELIRRIYRLRACNRKLPQDIGKERPCLYHHIHQCDAPCQGYIGADAYQQRVRGALEFLSGHYQETVQELREKMRQASDELRFEDAMEFRDLIQSIERIGERQKITGHGGKDNDVVAMAMDEEDAIVQVFFIRDGRLIGRDHFYLRVARGDTRGQVMTSFLKQFYAGTPFIPHELILQEEIEDREVIASWLTSRRGQKVHIHVPKKGTKEKMVEMAAQNAALLLSQDREKIKREEGRTIGAVKEVAGWLRMDSLVRMEAYDISNTSGFQSVGSMVVYERGKPKKSDYRKFKIQSVQGPNDYASMEEVLTRRFTHDSKGDFDSFARYPDLIMMDGGKGQVNVALEVLGKLGLQIPVCGMVKDDHHRTRGLYYNNEEIPIDTSSEGFRLITRIQDEAHRFAIEYHRSLRGKGQVHSVLDDIPGIGPVRRKALMKQYKSLEAIQQATREELRRAPSMNERSAAQVYDFFHGQEKQGQN